MIRAAVKCHNFHSVGLGELPERRIRLHSMEHHNVGIENGYLVRQQRIRLKILELLEVDGLQAVGL